MFCRLIAVSLLLPLFAHAAPRTEHVFVISFDGGNPQVMKQANMPNYQRLLAEGSQTLMASTIVPSKTCHLYKSHAADEKKSVDHRGRRYIKKKKTC